MAMDSTSNSHAVRAIENLLRDRRSPVPRQKRPARESQLGPGVATAGFSMSADGFIAAEDYGVYKVFAW